MKLSNIREQHIAAVCAAAFLMLLAYAAFAPAVHANPEGFMRKQPATATSSPAYLAPGTATTTYAFDTSVGNAFAPSATAALLIQFTGSSTAANLRWHYEYSQDTVCGTTGSNADWYAGDNALVGDRTATTSPATYTSGIFESSWFFASTTMGPTSKKLVMVPTPTRCVRVLFSLPAGSANGAVWAEWVAKKEVQ